MITYGLQRASANRAFAEECRRRVTISYPAADGAAYLNLNPAQVAVALAERAGGTRCDSTEPRYSIGCSSILPRRARTAWHRLPQAERAAPPVSADEVDLTPM